MTIAPTRLRSIKASVGEGKPQAIFYTAPILALHNNKWHLFKPGAGYHESYGCGMINGKRIAVVLPAYNAEKTLEATVRELPELVDIRILVDDHSSDRTVEVAKQLGLQSFVHDRNYGYGRNQQTCYREALAAGADVVIMLHPDYQYTPLLVTAMASMVAYGVYDVVLGSRIIGGKRSARRHAALEIHFQPLPDRVRELLSARQALRVSHRLSRVQPRCAHRAAAAGEFRRLRLRQPDAGAVRALRFPHRRGFLPHQVF